jgi:hypothetical protein
VGRVKKSKKKKREPEEQTRKNTFCCLPLRKYCGTQGLQQAQKSAAERVLILVGCSICTKEDKYFGGKNCSH